MIPRLVPFRAEHLVDLVDRDGLVPSTWEYAVTLERGGPAYTGVVDGKVIGCAGVRVLWPGVGEAWASLSQDAGRYGLWLTKIFRSVLTDIVRTQGLHRVEAQVLGDSERNRAWIEKLGFRREYGTAFRYTTDQRNVTRYELLP